MREMSNDEIRDTQLRVLASIADFCEERSITFYLFAGTLLGAVRHKGYIPWDDDIDIMMPRRDFERFRNEFVELMGGSGEISLYAPETLPDFPFPYIKVGDNRTLLVEASDTAVPIGVNVDIFPLDGWPAQAHTHRIHRLKIRFLCRLLGAKSVQPSAHRAWYRSLLLSVSKKAADKFPVRAIVQRITALGTAYAFDKSMRGGVIVWAYQESVPRAAYGTPVEVNFEERMYPAPADYECVLTSIYGDYMQLPPKDKQVSHHSYNAYWL